MQQDLRGLIRGRVTAFEEPDGRFAVATVVDDRGSSAYALPLALEGTEWRIEPWSAIRLSEPTPEATSVSARPRVEVEIVVAPLLLKVTGRLWIDGRPLESRVQHTGGRIRLVGRPEAQLSRGRHHVLALVRSDDEASALAWTFAAP